MVCDFPCISGFWEKFVPVRTEGETFLFLFKEVGANSPIYQPGIIAASRGEGRCLKAPEGLGAFSEKSGEVLSYHKGHRIQSFFAGLR